MFCDTCVSRREGVQSCTALSRPCKTHRTVRASMACMLTVSRIITPRLHLVPAHREDVWELWDLWRQPSIREPLFGLGSMPVELAAALIDACFVRQQALWVARSRVNARALGVISLGGWPHLAICPSALAPLPRRGEFSIAMHPSMRGSGHALEASSALLAHAFESGPLREISAACCVTNAPARGLLRSLGFAPYRPEARDGDTRIDHVLTVAGFRAVRTGLRSVKPAEQALAAGGTAFASADFQVTDQLPVL
jgi:RimJ/RimL family protein N-acetyltransferase